MDRRDARCLRRACRAGRRDDDDDDDEELEAAEADREDTPTDHDIDRRRQPMNHPHPHLRPHAVALAAATLATLLGAASPAARAQAAAAAPAPAASASAPAAPPAAAPLPAPVDAPQVVEVTAQGRRQEVQSVPIALQLVGPQQIEAIGAINIAELSSFVPGLSVDAAEPTQPSYSLRGLGNGDFGIGTDAPVGIYVNGLYQGKTGGALTNFNDVKRIEVLQGPQGTLFGRNSAGGAISIILNDPDGQNTAKGMVRAGSFGTFHTEGVLNRPVNDDLSLRLSLVGDMQDGWARNQYDANRYPNGNSWGSRLGARWSASEDTSVVVDWQHEDLHERPRPVWALADHSPNFDPEVTLVDPRKTPLQNDVHGGIESRVLNGMSVRVEHEIAPDLTLSSSTGWHHFKTKNIQDNDGTARIDSYLATGNFNSSNSWEQEFRLAGKTGFADWLTGVSLYQEKATQTSRIYTYTDSLDTLLTLQGFGPVFSSLDSLGPFIGVPVHFMGQSWNEEIDNTLTSRSAAVFADVIWHLGKSTNLTTGVRFTQDRKQFSWYNPLRTAPGVDAQLPIFSADTFAALTAMGVLTPEQAAGLEGAVAQFAGNLEFNNPAWLNGPVSRSKTWTNTSPRLVLDHHFSSDTMAYASVTRGYQAGGFNAVSTDVNGGFFDPETVTSYEAGLKGRVPSAGLTYSAAVFHYLFKDLQSITLDTGLPVPAYVITVSDVKATGADVDLQWQATKQIRLFTSAEYIDQVYAAQRNRLSDASDLTGQPYGTPKLTMTLGAGYQFALAGGLADASLQGALQTASRCNTDSVSQGNCIAGPGYRIGEAQQTYASRVGWTTTDKKYGVAFIVDNLTNKRYVGTASSLGSAVGSPYYASISAPRKFLFEVSVKL
jgi:iron complex outermembrane receptor protein